MNNSNEPLQGRANTAQRYSFFKLFGLGFIVGTLASALYLMLGGGYYFFDIPKWAEVVFYPGFVAGINFHEHVNFNETLSKVVGCFAVGISYGIVLVIIVALKRRFIGSMIQK